MTEIDNLFKVVQGGLSHWPPHFSTQKECKGCAALVALGEIKAYVEKVEYLHDLDHKLADQREAMLTASEEHTQFYEQRLVEKDRLIEALQRKWGPDHPSYDEMGQ